MNRKAIYLLSAPIRTGKTTALQHLLSGKKNSSGVLTPDVEGKRQFMDIATGQFFNMEAREDETNVLAVGRFRFSRHSFEKAAGILNQAPIADGWRIIDEIGPLELRGEGFGPVLKGLLADYAAHEMRLLLVVRDTLLDEVCRHFRLDDFAIVIIGKEDLEALVSIEYGA